MGRVRDRGVPRDACNNRSAASCTHPIPENRAYVSFLCSLYYTCAHLDYATGAHRDRDFASYETRVSVTFYPLVFEKFPSRSLLSTE